MYLLLRDVLLSLLLLHAKFVVHFLSTFTDVFPFAQFVDVCQTFSRLPFGFCQNVFNLWIILKKKKKGCEWVFIMNNEKDVSYMMSKTMHTY